MLASVKLRGKGLKFHLKGKWMAPIPFILALKEAGLIDVRRVGDASCFRVLGYEKFMHSMETRSFTGYPDKNNRSAEKLRDEELRRFGDQKPRTDLLD